MFQINYNRNKENWIKRSSKTNRKSNLKTKYGLSEQDYENKLIEQNYVCFICGEKTEKRLAVDHDHETGQTRDLLCHKCNMGLGCYNDDFNLLKKALNYLLKWKALTNEQD